MTVRAGERQRAGGLRGDQQGGDDEVVNPTEFATAPVFSLVIATPLWYNLLSGQLDDLSLAIEWRKV